MGATATTTPCNVLGRSRPFLALLLCFQLLHTSQAFEVRKAPDAAHCSVGEVACRSKLLTVGA